jgi:D-serine dehydratase
LSGENGRFERPLSSDPQPTALDTTPTSYDRAAVEQISKEALPAGTKGIPLDFVGVNLDDFVRSEPSVFDGGLSMPALLLREQALALNIKTMAEYAKSSGALLAPHGKTTMAPQLFARQIDAGAWAITVATPSQLRVARRFGVQRLFLANQLIDEAALRWLCEELERDPGFEFICLVDSAAGVQWLQRRLRRFGAARPISVLLEIGYEGGRCGTRDLPQAVAVAKAAMSADRINLIGIECYEGLNQGGDITATLRLVDRQLERFLATFVALTERDLLPPQPLVSAGGSAFFDRVVSVLGSGLGTLLLRSGCYITSDGGFYADTSPLAGRGVGDRHLDNALELWSTVLSRPEPERVIAGFGKRDAPYDMGLPSPLSWWREGCSIPGGDCEIVALNDQHAHIRTSPDADMAAGDLLHCSVSHPCGAFDRWRLIPIVDDHHTVVDAVLTYF